MRGGNTALRFSALALAVAAAMVPVAAWAQIENPNHPSSTDLVESPKVWDGEQVTFEGEVVGEAMTRGEHAWLHVNDDAYYLRNVEEGADLGGYNSGQAFWVPASLAEEITYFGDYQHEGDVVRITGTFNAACSEHGGDMDVHGSTMEIVNVGHVVTDPIHPWKVPTAIGMVLLAALALAFERGLPVRVGARRPSAGTAATGFTPRLPRRRP